MNHYEHQKLKSNISWLFAIVFATVWLLIAGIPFVFMILNSLKSQFEMLQKGVFQLPSGWYPNNYVNILSNGIVQYFLNMSLIHKTEPTRP